MVVIVLALITFINLDDNLMTTETQCDRDINADVACDGVRFPLWARVDILIIITAMGSFHTKATGAKELGADLVSNHASLAIAIAVQLRWISLSLADVAIGVIILDAQSMALSIQLSSKETLAS